MSLDLNDLLRDWPHEPGKLKVRKILGTDGKEKIQLRIDLGLIQMETAGRPDGQRPHNCESLLEWHAGRARRAEKQGETYALSPEDVGDIQYESIQYYHRYISLFQLGDYAGVMRDTQRNLDLFEFVVAHSGEELSEALAQHTPYVLMMHTRAKASIDLEREEFAAAVRVIQRGMGKIRAFYEKGGNADGADSSPELSFLNEWLEEVRGRQPVSKLEKMRREMEKAIESEAYERAAELRDAMRALTTRKS
jgi:UvrB/uvrC motif